jgi:hypothetical protein
MTDHLRPEEFVEVLDGVAEAPARAHLATCAECRAQLDELHEVMRESAGVDAPVPSPLFWDHFSDRVRHATAVLPARAPWWQGVWRPAAVFAAAAGAVALIVVLQSRPTDAPGLSMAEAPTTPVAEMAEMPDDGSWSLVVGLASELNYADVKVATEPVAGTADVMIAELTPSQRSELARLLEKEMGVQ